MYAGWVSYRILGEGCSNRVHTISCSDTTSCSAVTNLLVADLLPLSSKVRKPCLGQDLHCYTMVCYFLTHLAISQTSKQQLLCMEHSTHLYIKQYIKKHFFTQLLITCTFWFFPQSADSHEILHKIHFQQYRPKNLKIVYLDEQSSEL